MFKPIKYQIVFKDGEEIKVFPVSKMTFNNMGVHQAFFKPNPNEDAELFVEVDSETVFLQEFTAKYDKVGQEINSGDILAIKQHAFNESDEDVTFDVHYLVTFYDGAFLAISEIREESFPLTEQFCKTVTKVGTVYTTPELIQKEIDESVFAQNNDSENK